MVELRRIRCLFAVGLGLALAVPLRAADAPGAPATAAQRTVAAQATATQAAACTAIRPFYWEIGDAQRVLAGGAVGDGAPARDTRMPIASASKWIYAAYVAERRGGALTPDDIRFLSFRSGYTRFRFCRAAQTVAGCNASLLNGFGRADPASADRFVYNGGHMQEHATRLGLGALDKDALAAEIRAGLARLGADWRFDYVQPQLAGGAVTDVADYARFLMAVLDGRLRIGALLGAHAVCTNPRSCPDVALKTPIPAAQTWHYAIGHWVEDDPGVGDGAFSSPGAFGFYPWIGADRRSYGIVARHDRRDAFAADASERAGVQSVACGRLIRAAWFDGRARP